MTFLSEGRIQSKSNKIEIFKKYISKAGIQNYPAISSCKDVKNSYSFIHNRKSPVKLQGLEV